MEPDDLTKEAKEILIEALESNKGNIRSIEVGGTHAILVDKEELNDIKDEKYLKALNKLIRSRLIEKKQMESNIYNLTEDGKKLAEKI